MKDNRLSVKKTIENDWYALRLGFSLSKSMVFNSFFLEALQYFEWVFFDEPSSALDPIAEYQLNHAMLSATKDKTVIFISHRLSTTRLADHIIMLENGRIVERGGHDELLKLNGKYAEMWRVQAGTYI